MTPGKALVVTNVIALLVLLTALLLGWGEAAAFGLAVLLIMDLAVLVRGKQAQFDIDKEKEDDSVGEKQGASTSSDWPGITYQQAKAAYDAGQKLHLDERIYLVRRVPREPEDGLVLWVTDERTLGHHGLLLFPDGRVEAK